MTRITLFLFLSIVFSSCLKSARIGIFTQAESTHFLNIKGGSALLIISVPFANKERLGHIINRMLKIDDRIEMRKSAIQKGINIPAYIAPDKVVEHISHLSDNGRFDYLIIVDGYPMPTETNGGNLVSIIIEIWDIGQKKAIYNSHSTVKSKVRYLKSGENTRTGTIYNAIFADPIKEDELYYQGLKREIRKLKKVY